MKILHDVFREITQFNTQFTGCKDSAEKDVNSLLTRLIKLTESEADEK